MSYEDDVKRGQLAEAVLTNEVYTEAYSLIEQGILAKWRESDDREEREHLHKLQKLLDKAKGLMESTMRSGQVASRELERKRSLSERVGLKRPASWDR